MYLGIESSCDETSIALLKDTPQAKEAQDFVEYINSFTTEANLIATQVDIHSQYGGVIPEIGARKHAEQIHWLFLQTISQITKKPLKSLQMDEEAKKVVKSMKAIFVTTEPGLASALRVGEEFAKTIQYFILRSTGRFLPILHINHLRGHVISCFYNYKGEVTLPDIRSDESIFPHLHLLVSGGNSQIIWMESPSKATIIGQTVDDAAGESLDKIGRMVGLPYPGGVHIAKIAKLNTENPLSLPVGMKKSTSLDYSFSGLKTAVRYHVQKQDIPGFGFEKPLSIQEIQTLLESTGDELTPKLQYIYDVATSSQSVIVRQLANKFKQAVNLHTPRSIGISGGVSANQLLRKKMQHIAETYSLPLFIPHLKLTGDNAVMIALAGIAEGYKTLKVVK